MKAGIQRTLSLSAVSQRTKRSWSVSFFSPPKARWMTEGFMVVKSDLRPTSSANCASGARLHLGRARGRGGGGGERQERSVKHRKVHEAKAMMHLTQVCLAPLLCSIFILLGCLALDWGLLCVSSQSIFICSFLLGRISLSHSKKIMKIMKIVKSAGWKKHTARILLSDPYEQYCGRFSCSVYHLTGGTSPLPSQITASPFSVLVFCSLEFKIMHFINEITRHKVSSFFKKKKKKEKKKSDQAVHPPFFSFFLYSGRTRAHGIMGRDGTTARNGIRKGNQSPMQTGLQFAPRGVPFVHMRCAVLITDLIVYRAFLVNRNEKLT